MTDFLRGLNIRDIETANTTLSETSITEERYPQLEGMEAIPPDVVAARETIARNEQEILRVQSRQSGVRLERARVSLNIERANLQTDQKKLATARQLTHNADLDFRKAKGQGAIKTVEVYRLGDQLNYTVQSRQINRQTYATKLASERIQLRGLRRKNNEAVAGLTGFNGQTVDVLPSTGGGF